MSDNGRPSPDSSESIAQKRTYGPEAGRQKSNGRNRPATDEGEEKKQNGHSNGEFQTPCQLEFFLVSFDDFKTPPLQSVEHREKNKEHDESVEIRGWHDNSPARKQGDHSSSSVGRCIGWS